MRTRLVSRILVIFLALLCSTAVSGQVQDPAAKEQPKPTPQSDAKIKIVFDDETPGVAFIEVNGERVRVDTLKKTVEHVDAATVEKAVAAKTGSEDKEKTATKDEEDKYDFDKGDEPYDYRVVNVPTPRHVGKGTWALTFTHRFDERIFSKQSPKDLFGLDSFGIASFGVTYGFTDKLYGTVYRSPLCQRGICRTIEVGVGYNWKAMDKESPFAVATYASIEGNDNFSEEYTYNLQARFAYRLTKRIYLFFSPAVHINSNGQRRFDPRPTDFFPPAPIADTFRMPRHSASFGFGSEFLITPNVVFLLDIAPRIGFKLGRVTAIRDPVSQAIVGFENDSHQSYGFGVQRNIGKHSFALTLSNTQTTTTSRYNSSNLFVRPNDVTIGFNLTRRF